MFVYLLRTFRIAADEIKSCLIRATEFDCGNLTQFVKSWLTIPLSVGTNLPKAHFTIFNPINLTNPTNIRVEVLAMYGDQWE